MTADLTPAGPALTAYDEEQAITYLRMLDADAEGADWRDVARIVLNIDPEQEPDRAAGSWIRVDFGRRTMSSATA